MLTTLPWPSPLISRFIGSARTVVVAEAGVASATATSAAAGTATRERRRSDFMDPSSARGRVRPIRAPGESGVRSGAPQREQRDLGRRRESYRQPRGADAPAHVHVAATIAHLAAGVAVA